MISYNLQYALLFHLHFLYLESDLGGEFGQYGRGASITGAAETIQSLSQHSP